MVTEFRLERTIQYRWRRETARQSTEPVSATVGTADSLKIPRPEDLRAVDHHYGKDGTIQSDR